MNRKSLLSLALAAALPALSGVAKAQSLVTFEGASSFTSVAEFHNGGTDGTGVAGTSNFGIAFTGAALALSNDVLGPYFSNAPSPLTVMFATDFTAYMNVAAGFTRGLALHYSYLNPNFQVGLDLVKIYSGLNGTGTLLASMSLFPNAQLGCTDSPFCRFSPSSVLFAGIAQSVSFGGEAGMAAFDNIAVTVVPEPGTAAMLLAGLCATGFMTARRCG